MTYRFVILLCTFCVSKGLRASRKNLIRFVILLYTFCVSKGLRASRGNLYPFGASFVQREVARLAETEGLRYPFWSIPQSALRTAPFAQRGLFVKMNCQFLAKPIWLPSKILSRRRCELGEESEILSKRAYCSEREQEKLPLDNA